jgi:phosphate transport system permease protein
MSAQQVIQAPREEDGARNARLTRLVQRLHATNNVWLGVLTVIAAIVALIFVAIIVYLVVQGFTHLINPSFYNTSDAGVGREIFNTFYVLIFTEIILTPLALAAAIYLVEYAPQGGIVTVIHFAAETLAGIPTIVIGLFGALVFTQYAHFGFSRIAGVLTLICLSLPTGLRLFEDALTSVPREMREGGLALGATKWHVIRTVVIPSALPGIITGLILTAGRIIGEAAALLFTMGLTSPSNVFTLNPLLPSDTLTTHLYYIAGPGAGSGSLTTAQETAITSGSSALLIVLLLLINIVARVLGRAIQRRVTAA